MRCTGHVARTGSEKLIQNFSKNPSKTFTEF